MDARKTNIQIGSNTPSGGLSSEAASKFQQFSANQDLEKQRKENLSQVKKMKESNFELGKEKKVRFDTTSQTQFNEKKTDNKRATANLQRTNFIMGSQEPIAQGKPIT